MIIAYRKAKTDLYYSSNPRISDLYEYEKNLEKNLLELWQALSTQNEDWFQKEEFLGSFDVRPSKAQKPFDKHSEKGGEKSQSEIIRFTDQDLEKEQDDLRVEFRVMEKCSIHFHVLSAYWIAKIGTEFDKQLGSEVYANRVRRGSEGEYNALSIGSFQPYFHGYKEWRDAGHNAMQRLLEEEIPAVAVTADIKGYFHNLRPSFLNSDAFKNTVNFSQSDFKETELFAHQALCTALVEWEKSVASSLGVDFVGLPVGLAASGLIANIALIEFDKQISEEVKPRFYGRYVDDIMIVLEGGKHFAEPKDIWEWLDKRVPSIRYSPLDDGHDDSGDVTETINIAPSFLESSNLQLGPSKTKIFELDGFNGQQMLAALQRTLRENSSAWNLLPSIPDAPDGVPSLIIKALDDEGADVSDLSKVTNLTTTRSNFAIQLRNFEALGRDVTASTWKEHREKFYEAIQKQVLTPSKYFELADYFPRILSLAVSCEDWKSARDLIDGLYQVKKRFSSTSEFELKSIGNAEVSKAQSKMVYERWTDSLSFVLVETINASIGIEKEKEALREFIQDQEDLGAVQVEKLKSVPSFIELFSRDLAKVPYKILLASREFKSRDLEFDSNAKKLTVSLSDCDLGGIAHGFKNFIETLEGIYKTEDLPEWNAYGLIFATRPIGVYEILLWTRLMNRPEFSKNLGLWLTVTRGYKGNNWLPDGNPPEPSKGGGNGSGDGKIIALNYVEVPDVKGTVRVAVGSLCTSSDDMAAAALGRPNLSLKRYKKITKLINDVLQSSENKPHYLLLPEISIPAEWFIRLALKLMNKDISLIAGVEFLPCGSKEIRNQMWHGLVHDELGFKSLAIYRQDKQRPAPGEELFLWELNQLYLSPEIKFQEAPPVIQHGNFKFSSLICSELMNIGYRSAMRGKIDSLMLSESNQDLNTFNSLVEAAALDIHCYVVQANNRSYGDSRIRAPYKTDYKRDIIRIRGGLDDHFVTGEFNIRSLRKFQSRYRDSKGEFKPLPDGFHDAMDSHRKIYP